VAAALDSSSQQLLGVQSFPVTTVGYVAMLAWFRQHGPVDVVGIEGTGTYGAGLTRHLTRADVDVREVNRPDRAARRLHGKSDPLDAEAAARAVLAGRATGLPKSRDGCVEALRMLRLVYTTAVTDRTEAINQFHAVLSTAVEPIREELAGMTISRQLQQARRWRDRPSEDLVSRTTRTVLGELALRIGHLDEQATRMDRQLTELTEQAAPALLDIAGIGIHTAAQLLVTVGDNPHRLHNEAAFAHLCGVAPVPASSGKTTRHRLDRGGDRAANHALWRIVMARIAHKDPRTLDYIARRTREGMSKREIIRCLKRYVAREVFRVIMNPPEPAPTGAAIRTLRTAAGLTQIELSHLTGLPNTTISRLERGQLRRGDLQRRCHDELARRSLHPTS
jgi:transposase/DNA-binding XRE family transcriptional regulator